MSINKAKPVICFLGDASSVHLQRWVVASLQRGFAAHIITRREWKGSPVDQTVMQPGASPLGWFIAVPELLRALSSIKPDIVHAHYATSYGFWAALSGMHPMVITAWGTDILVTPKRSRWARFLTGWSLRKADLITADSDVMLEEISDYHPKAHLEVIQWGVDVSRFAEKNTEKDVTKGPQIVSIRMWEPNYNIDILLRGFRQFCDAWSGTMPTLHLIGGGTLDSSLRKLVHELDLGEQVEIHGFLAEEALINILATADISISIPTSDATAMSVLESMAAGVPLIVSDLPDNHYWVGNEGGIVIEHIDATCVAEALGLLMNSSELRAQMGERNRLKVSREADRKLHMDRMAALYQQLLEEQEKQLAR